jgi:rubrerythrin
MNTQTLKEALMMGLKNEMDSVTVYADAAERTSGDVSSFFKTRSDEEKRHYNWLLEYYKKVQGGTIPNYDLTAEVFGLDTKSPLLTKDFIKRLAADQHLVTAVTTATLMESTAIGFYRSAAEQAPNKELASFFTTLMKWEEKHYQELLSVQDELAQAWFEKQNFEPF